MQRETKHLCLAAVALLAVAGAAWAATDVSINTDGRVTLVSGTPQAIGSNTGRIELRIKNDDTGNNAYCGGTPGALSATPGPNSGFQYDPGRMVTEFVFPDKAVSCMAPVGLILSFHEARMVTATVTPTRTP